MTPTDRRAYILAATKRALVRRIRRLPVYPYHTWDKGRVKSETGGSELVCLLDVLALIVGPKKARDILERQ